MTTSSEPTVTELRADVRSKRRAFAVAPESRFVRAMRKVMADYLAARAEGVSREDAVKGIEEVLRAESIFRVSKFQVCEECGAGGWRVTYCTHNRRCGREKCSMAEPEWEHSYAVYCDCEAGVNLRANHARKSVQDDLASVGKTRRKPRGFTPIGR